MKIKAETIIRTAILCLTLVNQVLVMLGANPLPFAEEDVYEVLSTVLTIGATAWAWWKNNSVTGAAIEADEYLENLKSGEGK